MIFVARTPDEIAEANDLNERYKNFKKNNVQLEDFRSLKKMETDMAMEKYLAARKAYVMTLEKFIVANVTSPDDFSVAYEKAYRQACNCYNQESGDWAVDQLLTLEWMVDEHEYWLEDGIFSAQIEAEYEERLQKISSD